jgi:hypothetical protein
MAPVVGDRRDQYRCPGSYNNAARKKAEAKVGWLHEKMPKDSRKTLDKAGPDPKISSAMSPGYRMV